MTKLCTSVEQSKMLVKLGLDVNTADMYYPNRIDIKYQGVLPIEYKHGNPLLSQEIAAWSLAALYHILPNTEYISTTLSRGGWEIEQPEYVDKWWCEYEDENDHTRDIIINADNPVDACVAMIENLHKLKIL